MDKLKRTLVTGLGTGYLPVAPGTWGSAAVCAIFLLVAWGSSGRWYCATVTMGGIAVASSAICVLLGGFTEKAFGRKDPGQCTIDEYAGQAVALMFLPMGAGWAHRLIVAGVAFVAFRIADIIKPPPADAIQKLPLGWGVLLDDIFAGIYANIVAQLFLRLVMGH